MRLYFNRRPVSGPWGGGSKVLRSIVEESIARGHEVFFEEDVRTSKDFDVIFCMDPRPSTGVSIEEIVHTKRRGIPMLHRVGDLGTHGKPDLFDLQQAVSMVADIVVFPSKWAKEGLATRPDGVVIPNAPLSDFTKASKRKTSGGRVKIVTHHWSDNSMKGFDVYGELDRLCNEDGRFSFTFIGRKPPSCNLTNHIEPLDVVGLVDELPRHDFYFTASKKEAGANHVLEAMALGLPVLFDKDGGSIPEYCEGRGRQYDTPEDALRLIESGEIMREIEPLTRTTVEMAKEYVDLMETMR